MRKILSLLLLLGCMNAVANTRMDASFYLGPSIFQTGNIQDLGTPTANTSIEFNYYFQDKHGIGLSMGNEFDFDGTGRYRYLSNASIHTFELHYAFRHAFENSNWRLYFAPGVGWQTLYNESRDYYWGYFYYDSLSSSWVINYKLMMDYVVKRWDNGGSSGEFFIGGGVTQILSLDDDLNGHDISGSRFSALFRLGLGF